MKHSRYAKSFLSTLTIGLTAILLMTGVSQLSAETTKQKRERLKAQSGKAGKPHEPGKTYFGIAYGTVPSATAKVNGRTFTDDVAEKKQLFGIFIDVRAARKFHVGPSFNTMSAEVFGIYKNRLYDIAISPKLTLFESAAFKIRPGAALGMGFIPEKYGAEDLTLTTKKLFVEGDLVLSDRLGFLVDLGLWWASGSNKVADASGHCLYGRIGLIFL